jgi:NAD(P)H-dependent FMN reductase
MKIAVILGSVREGRQSHKVAQELANRLALQESVEVELIDLADVNLPIMTERLSKMANPPANLVQFSQSVDKADAIVFVTPEYNGSYTGVLKNAIDYLLKEFHRKPIGVATVAGGKFGGLNATHHLQSLVLHMGAFPMPLKLVVPFVQNAFDAEENLIDETLTKSFEVFVKEFIWFAEAIVFHKQRALATV